MFPVSPAQRSTVQLDLAQGGSKQLTRVCTILFAALAQVPKSKKKKGKKAPSKAAAVNKLLKYYLVPLATRESRKLQGNVATPFISCTLRRSRCVMLIV